MKYSGERWGVWRKRFAIAVYNSAIKPEVGFHRNFMWINFYHLYVRIG